MTIGRFLAGIGALIWDADSQRYLVLRRASSKDFAAGAWECVTGRLEQGEGFEAALHREVAEEIGVAVEPLFLIGTTHFYRGEHRPENELVGVVYCCSVADPTAIRLSHEHAKARWITAAEGEGMLRQEHPTEAWLWRVIERAEQTRRQLAPKLTQLHRRRGFELG
ncbi:MAG: NUDIX domain-containing protein [Candidatus Promineifilaceae bacterium]|nr:NUDIX domain-containing protein [Candidatus Promineifilaceae bacterium]